MVNLDIECRKQPIILDLMVYLPQDAIVAEAKLTHYLLIFLPKDDKALFLAKAGYTLENWRQLEQDLRSQLLPLAATPIAETEFGIKYRIRGQLTGLNQMSLPVISIWLVDSFTQQTKFVTLFPDQGG